ncbi:ATP dependent DNA ligase [Chryseolinea sp. T2]
MFCLEPKLVCNVTYCQITSDGIVRHPVLQGLRI